MKDQCCCDRANRMIKVTPIDGLPILVPVREIELVVSCGSSTDLQGVNSLIYLTTNRLETLEVLEDLHTIFERLKA